VANKTTIKEALKARLQDDCPERLKSAGTSWAGVPLGFYYATPEEAVDIAIAEVIAEVLDANNEELPKNVADSLRKAVSLTTLVKGAVEIMWMANLMSVPK